MAVILQKVAELDLVSCMLKLKTMCRKSPEEKRLRVEMPGNKCKDECNKMRGACVKSKKWYAINTK